MNQYKYKEENGTVHRLHVEREPEPENPRELGHPVGKMFCQHKRYKLGDTFPYRDWDGLIRDIMAEAEIPMEAVLDYGKTRPDSGEWDPQDISIDKLAALAEGRLIVLPLYLYDHSGLSMSTADFGDPWDSGRVGIIWATLKQAKVCGFTGSPEELRKNIIDVLEEEVREYDLYLKGEIYGYVEEALSDGEWVETDSCWGFMTDAASPLDEIVEQAWSGCEIFDELPTSTPC